MTDWAPKPGTIGWFDLTVPDAPEIRDFYAAVVGWEAMPISMGEYDDYAMAPAGSEQATCGICHARGENAGQPSGWMAYIMVPNLDASLRETAARGGAQIGDTREAGGARFAVIRDPSGATIALMETQAA